jgi:hypothetical protein
LPADQRVRLRAGLEHRRLGVAANVARYLEVAEGAGALGMGLALRDPLSVEVGHLLDEVVVLQQDRAVGANRERELVGRYRDTGVGGGRVGAIGHATSLETVSFISIIAIIAPRDPQASAYFDDAGACFVGPAGVVTPRSNTSWWSRRWSSSSRIGCWPTVTLAVER